MENFMVGGKNSLWWRQMLLNTECCEKTSCPRLNSRGGESVQTGLLLGDEREYSDRSSIHQEYRYLGERVYRHCGTWEIECSAVAVLGRQSVLLGDEGGTCARGASTARTRKNCGWYGTPTMSLHYRRKWVQPN